MTLLRDFIISNVLSFPFLFTTNWKILKSEILGFLLFRGNEFFWLLEFSAGILVRKSDLQISIEEINSIFPFRKLQILISIRILQ